MRRFSGHDRHPHSFAALCGVRPLAASSGKTSRRRLNRGGDRQANAALYRIALSRLRWDARTRDYLADASPKAQPAAKPSAASSDTLHARSTKSSHPHPKHSRQRVFGAPPGKVVGQRNVVSVSRPRLINHVDEPRTGSEPCSDPAGVRAGMAVNARRGRT
ncbi:MAG: transposase, partial [Pseudonocardiaceae bacterium]